MKNCSLCENWTTNDWITLVIAEAAFFGLVYYIQTLLNVAGNLYWSTSIMLFLIHVTIFVCPVTRKWCK